MKNSYYPTTTPKIIVFVVTILLFIWTIIDSTLIHLGGLAFASLVMLMFHFHFYESTSDKNIFNKIDFILQLFLVFISIIKFFVISGVN